MLYYSDLVIPLVRNVLDPITPSEPAFPSQVKELVRRLRLDLKGFFRRSHPVWLPRGNPDIETTQFYRDLAVPLVKNKPSLLLHDIGVNSNPHADDLFKPGNNR